MQYIITKVLVAGKGKMLNSLLQDRVKKHLNLVRMYLFQINGIQPEDRRI